MVIFWYSIEKKKFPQNFYWKQKFIRNNLRNNGYYFCFLAQFCYWAFVLVFKKWNPLDLNCYNMTFYR